MSPLLLSALFSFGCAGPVDLDTGDPDAPDAPADTGETGGAADTADTESADTGAPEDTGETDDTGRPDRGGQGGDGPAAAEICERHLGVIGADGRWSYAFTNGAVGSYDVQTLDWDAADATATMQHDVYMTQGAHEIFSTQVGEYRCDEDGVWLLSARMSYAQYDDGALTKSYETPNLITEPILTAPASLSVGATWELSGTRYEVVAEEDHAVPAGTFPALRVEIRDGGDTWTQWMAPGVGMVENWELELVSYTL